MSESLPVGLAELVDDFASYEWIDLAWALGIALVAWLAGRAVAGLLMRTLARWSSKTETVIDDAVSLHLRTPLVRLIPWVAVVAVLPVAGLPPDWEAGLRHLLLLVLIVGMGWVLVRTVRVLEHVVEHRHDLTRTDNLEARAAVTQMRGFRNIAVFLISVVTVAFVLLTFDRVRELGAGMLASAGLAGIILGFAAQQSLGALLAGIQIAITQPIRVDDVVIVDGEWGRIEEITLTYVVIRIWDLRRLVVPIRWFLDNPFQNWTRVSANLLATVTLHLDYSVPVERIRQQAKRLVEASPLWDKQAFGVQVTDATERTMTIRVLMSTRDSGSAWDLRCEVREQLLGFIEREYPGALPRHRVDIPPAPRELHDPPADRPNA